MPAPPPELRGRHKEVSYGMLQRCHSGLAILASSVMLLAGCASPGRVPSHESSAPRKLTAKATRDVESPEVDPKLIEAHAHYAQAIIDDLDEQPDSGLKEFAEAARLDPGNEPLALDLSRRYLLRKQPDQALEVLVRAAAVPNASGTIFAQLGLVYSRLGKDDKAVEASQTAVKRSPQLLAGYRNLFLFDLQKAKYVQALTLLDGALKQPDTDAGFLIDLSELYIDLGRQAPSFKAGADASAHTALQRAAALNPNSPRLQLRLADGFNSLGDVTNAAPIYLEMLDRYPDEPNLREDVRGKLTDLYLRANDPGKAIEQLEAIIHEDPANARAYFDLGELASAARKLPEAEDFFHKALLLGDELGDDAQRAYYDLAEVQINLDHAQDALSTLQKARAKYQETFLGEFLTGLAYGAQRDYTNAVRHYTAAELLARATDPKRLNQFFYFQAGAAYERQGDYPQAEQYLEKAVELEPDFAEALNYLGYMLADRGVKLERAREMIEKAVKIEPKNAAYLDSLGWVLYKLNQPSEALPQLLKAIDLSDKPDATLYDHLGDIYAAMKQNEKAREAWRKSLDVEPNEQIQKKLEPAAK